MGYLTRSLAAGPKPVSNTPLFEIRLSGLERGVLVIKGPPHEASSALLSGKIVLALNEPIHIRKLSLKLYGDLRLNWVEHLESSTTSYSKPTKYTRRVYEHTWDNFDLPSARPSGPDLAAGCGSVPEHSKMPFHLGKHSKSSTSLLAGNKNKRPGDATPVLSPTGSSTTLNRLSWHANSKSIRDSHSSNATSSAGSEAGSHKQLPSPTSRNGDVASQAVSHGTQGGHILAKGNHEIPFFFILPGDLSESVEGLPGGSVVYKLEAAIERGKFTKKKTTSKHLRIVRTLTPDAPELAETMSIDNIWPKKVEYTISIPSRAMAIGSACPINFLMVPLLKGLKMGKITVKLIEYYSFFGNNLRHGHSNDRVISEVIIPRPDDGIYDEEEPRSLTEGNPLLNPANNFMSLSYDRWEVEKSLQIPPSLTKCTQDATVGRNLKVRHKLSIVVALKNPNGHTSELRASLPVILYISPFVRVSAKYSEHALHNNFSDTIPLLSAEHHIINSLNVSKNKKGTATSPLYKRRSNPSSNSSSTTDLNKLDFNSSGNNNNDSVDFDDSGEPDNEVLFSNADLGNVVDGSTGRPDLVAPPNYGEHIYDKLWSDLDTPSSPGAMTPMGYGSMTPMAFGAMTPSGFKTPSGAATAPGGMVGGRTPGTQTPTSSSLRLSQSKFNSQLTKHLNELHLQRLAEEDNDGSIDGITESANAGGHPEVVVSSANDPNQPGVSSVPAARDSLQMDYFSLPKRPARSTIATPISPDAHHISRRNSSNLLNSFDAVGLQSLVETPTNWDNNSLSRVPSYGTATKSYVDQALLSPTYDESIDNSSSTSLNSSGNNNASLASQNPGFAGAVAGSAYNNSASSPGGVSSSSDGGTHISSPAPSRPTAKRNSSFLHLRFGGGKNMLPSKQGESHGMGFPLTLPEKYAHAAKNRLSGKDKSGSKDKTSSDKSGKSKVGSEKPGNNTSSTSPASTIVPSRIPTSVSGTGELEYGAKKGARQK